jgi:hypothetical protein
MRGSSLTKQPVGILDGWDLQDTYERETAALHGMSAEKIDAAIAISRLSTVNVGSDPFRAKSRPAAFHPKSVAVTVGADRPLSRYRKSSRNVSNEGAKRSIQSRRNEKGLPVVSNASARSVWQHACDHRDLRVGLVFPTLTQVSCLGWAEVGECRKHG